jgi:hypothetical protein
MTILILASATFMILCAMFWFRALRIFMRSRRFRRHDLCGTCGYKKDTIAICPECGKQNCQHHSRFVKIHLSAWILILCAICQFAYILACPRHVVSQLPDLIVASISPITHQSIFYKLDPVYDELARRSLRNTIDMDLSANFVQRQCDDGYLTIVDQRQTVDGCEVLHVYFDNLLPSSKLRIHILCNCDRGYHAFSLKPNSAYANSVAELHVSSTCKVFQSAFIDIECVKPNTLSDPRYKILWGERLRAVRHVP